MDAAIEYAKEMQGIWGDDQEQIELHMESEGFLPDEIMFALDALNIYQPVFVREIALPA